MQITEFDYELPEDRIAQHPLASRDESRLLVVDRAAGAWSDHIFKELPLLLRGNELVVVNNARVIRARLFARRAGVGAEPVGRRSRHKRKYLKAKIEVLLSRRVGENIWEALVRPGRKVRRGERLIFGDGELEAEVIGRGAYGLRVLRFAGTQDVAAVSEQIGHVPLPPYIHRPDAPEDAERYQTVYAKRGAAVAAPTAGLHFTEKTLAELHARGIELAELTLNVGLGTFQPIRGEKVEGHRMHPEWYEIPEETAEKIRRAKQEKRPVLAVGTTVVRALEDAAQKLAREHPSETSQVVRAGAAEADLFIYPGYEFRVVDQLLTNFHLPRSSLVVLVCAFGGRDLILRAYRHAVGAGYRFYSYGDCMLIR
jgi:S-adenosylmethionine:tRNA ribosyltransferase-isomerase